eukprot:gene15777-17369_t
MAGSDFNICEMKELSMREVITTIGTACGSVWILCIATLANTLLLVTLIKRPTGLQVGSVILFTCMVVSDLLVGSGVQALKIIVQVKQIMNRNSCGLKKSYFYASYLLAGCSTFIVMMISVDRMLAVAYPIRYRTQSLTRKYAAFIFCGYTFIASLLGSFGFGKIEYDDFSRTVAVFIVFMVVAIVTFNTIIYVMTKKNNQVISQLNAQKISTLLKAREKKLATTTRYIVVCFMLCNTPRFVSSVVASCFNCNNTEWMFHLKRWTALLVFCSSALNPFIYFYRVGEIRQAVKSTLSRRKQQPFTNNNIKSNN